MTADLHVPVLAVGLCGTDIHRHRVGYDTRSLGHELVGTDPRTGAPVAIRPLAPCRTCPMCCRRWTEHCSRDGGFGRNDDYRGGFSGTVETQPDQLYRIPAGVDVTLATLADPLACILHAVHDVAVDGAQALVIGDGPMAVLAATHLRQLGAAQVTICVKAPDRASRLSRFADHAVIARDLAQNSYDVVLESVGGISSEAILEAVVAVAPLGTVVALGVYPLDTTASLPVRALLEKESTLRGSKAYRITEGRDDFGAALRLLAAAPDEYAPLITSVRRWSPDDLPEALTRDGELKIVYLNSAHATDHL